VDSTIARYEFIAHIKANNQRLYIDLVVKGLLHQRARLVHPHCGLLSYDVWLTSPTPIYRRQRQQQPLPITAASNNISLCLPEVIPLWFYRPSNGMQEQVETTNVSHSNTSSTSKNNKKKRGIPWIPFAEHDIRRLEQSYRSYIMEMKTVTTLPTSLQGEYNTIYKVQETSTGPLCHAIYDSVISTLGFVPETVKTNTSKGTPHPHIENAEESIDINTLSVAEKAISCALRSDCHQDATFPYHKTVAHWYDPDLSKDILVDQKRYAVSFLECDVNKDEDEDDHLLLTLAGDISNSSISATTFPMDLSLAGIKMLRRPTLWRFHGPGDEVRRATWVSFVLQNGLHCQQQAFPSLLCKFLSLMFVVYTSCAKIFCVILATFIALCLPNLCSSLVCGNEIRPATIQ
jgi:hypothetical protein